MKHCFKYLFIAIFLQFYTTVTGQNIPEWVTEHIDYLTSEGGSWLADNSLYKNKKEPYSSYGMHWKKTLGPASMKGNMFGINEEGIKIYFWEFTYFWHPGKSQFCTIQYGISGMLGEGKINSSKSKTSEAIETFFLPDGKSYQVGHKAQENPNEFITESFDISEDQWTPRRKYNWIKQKTG